MIAFYLPQFHSIPENDEWWGKGFTEWTNVRKAKPLFHGHVQPKIPGELGYYNLLDPTARENQAKLAQASGIEAFCYWHYWFGGGRRLLEKPFEEVLRSQSPDMNFCLCWANQTWTGVWHGAPNRVLAEQTYPGKKDLQDHFEAVLPAFRDKRYLTIDGKPLFLVYRPSELPDPKEFSELWRMLAKQAGLDGLFLIAMSNSLDSSLLQYFDGIIASGPGDFLDTLPAPGPGKKLVHKIVNGKLGRFVPRSLKARVGFPRRYDYAVAAERAFGRLSSLANHEKFYPCILSGWDNTPRSHTRGVVFENFTPEKFRVALRRAIRFSTNKEPERKIVFLKAWNEWAEGNYLEPDKEFGTAMLDVVRDETLSSNPE